MPPVGNVILLLEVDGSCFRRLMLGSPPRGTPGLPASDGGGRAASSEVTAPGLAKTKPHEGRGRGR